MQEATRAIKKPDPEFYVITDVCMCEYTSHGHCGMLDDRRHASTTTRPSSCSPRTAVTHAEAGADMVAPERHDGRPRRRRSAARSTPRASRDIPIMAYA